MPPENHASAERTMVKLRNVILLFIIIAAFPAISPAEVIDRIAAIVNDEIITSYEVDKGTFLLVKEAEKNGPLSDADKAKLHNTALNRLIDKKLIDQKVKDLNITVSDEDLRLTIEDVKKQNKMSQENFIAALTAQGLTYAQYQAQLREQIERLKLMGQEVRSKIQVGEKEVKEYYNANLKSYSTDTSFRARHIFFRLGKEPDPKEIKKVMTNALMVLQEAISGKDFAELAKKYSDDPQAAKDGGDLGTFKKGDMLPAIEDNVINMKPDEISDLVITPAGFHIIKLEEKTPGKIRTFEEVKGEIEDMLYKKKSEERFNQWLADLRKAAAIEIKGR
jgi:peptidyl-prolyl cis-trans isomerase SurA